MGGILMALVIGYVLGALTWHRVWPWLWARLPRSIGGGGALLLLLACAASPAPTEAQGAPSHEPPGLRTIVDLDFGPTKPPLAYVTGPAPTYGVGLGKVRADGAGKVVPAPGGYAYRQTFGLNAVTARGVGGTLYAKEALPGNTDGNTARSYQLYYETGTFYFGGARGEASFENMGSDGFKLLGYWGGMCPGNTNASQLIGWAAPAAGRVDFQVTPVSQWRLQLRWNAGCSPTNVQASWKEVRPASAPTFMAGAWHTYELLADAGDLGQANGSVTVWIDGVQMIRFQGMLRTATAPRGWFGRHWNPVLNGKPGLRKTRVDVLDVDRLAIKVGRPID